MKKKLFWQGSVAGAIHVYEKHGAWAHPSSRKSLCGDGELNMNLELLGMNCKPEGFCVPCHKILKPEVYKPKVKAKKQGAP